MSGSASTVWVVPLTSSLKVWFTWFPPKRDAARGHHSALAPATGGKSWEGSLCQRARDWNGSNLTCVVVVAVRAVALTGHAAAPTCGKGDDCAAAARNLDWRPGKGRNGGTRGFEDGSE